MSRATQIILSLTPQGLRGALVKNGQVVQGESCPFGDTIAWGDAWDDGLRPFDQSLRQLVSRLSQRGVRKTTLVYQSPSAAVQFLEIDGTKNTAMEQAESKIRESVGRGSCVDTRILAHGAAGSHPCLTIADEDTTTRKLYAWMTRCGLKPDQMIPTGCVMMAHAIEASLRQRDKAAVCYLGEESSVIAYAIDGTVKLVRSIEIGYRHLNDSYRGAFANKSDDQEQNPEIAAMLAGNRDVSELIWEHGIPISSKGDQPQVLRREILPRIAPILQRYSVEIKQTFRFGVSQPEVPSNLVMCGPGAAIPHIGAALSQNCDLHIDLVQGAETYTPMKPFASGTLEGQFAESTGSIPGILPRIAREGKQRTACNIAVAAGIAIVVGIMAVEVGSVQMQSRSIRSEMARDETMVQAIQNERIIREQALSHAAAVDQIATVFTRNYGPRPQWSSVFEGVTKGMGKSIRIEQIQGDNTDRGATVGLTGLAIETDGVEAGAVLTEFARSLRGHDGVLEVRLGATSRRSAHDGRSGVHFELTMVVDTQNAPFEQYTAFVAEEGNP